MSKIIRPRADNTRQTIIKSARKLFVKKGFSATSISDIAFHAGINQSLIYHHFGNKQKLWKMIKVEVLAPSHPKMTFEELLKIENVEDFVSAFVQFRFELYDRSPDLRRIIDWQLLEGDSKDLIAIPSAITAQLEEKLMAFQKKKVLTKKYEVPLLLTFLLSAPLGFFRSYRDLMHNLSKAEQEKLKIQYCNLVSESILSGILIK